MRSKAITDIIETWEGLSQTGLLPSGDLKPGDLPKAAATFALAGVRGYAKAGWPEVFWPWRRPRFRAGERRENLVRAGAFILAEIERLDRLSTEAE
jgi:hypothetical protein